ncbi:MAG: reverse transcriptase/maturase family protein [Verrucomicrobia bacterium]|nr:reverse transcriptase/maturase family protein [Verrucomicrobiota bacterium]
MKRAGNLLGRITAPENLRLAFWKAAKGKWSRPATREFSRRLEAEVARLASGLADGSFPFGAYRSFRVFDPKERWIHAAAFPERVAHHAIMNLCEPVFERAAVFDSFACRKGKGQVAAGERARRHARWFPWFLKMDVRKYFDSIPHARLLDLLERLFKDPALLDLFRKIVGSYETHPGHGLPIGSLTSQYFANHFLTGLDRFARETLRAPGYVRYMDDFALWHPDKGFLKEARDRIIDWLAAERGLVVKPEPLLNRTERGMDFLGLRIFPNTVRLNHRSKIRFLRRLRALEGMESAGLISEAELQCRATCLVAFTRHADTLAFRRDALFPKDKDPDGGHTAPTASSVAEAGTTTRTTHAARTATTTTRPTPTTTTDSAWPEFNPARECRRPEADPATVPPAPPPAAWQRESARPVLVAAVEAAANAPGGPGASHSPRRSQSAATMRPMRGLVAAVCDRR